MTEYFQFIYKNYSSLILLALVFWGLGQTTLKCITSLSEDKWLDLPMACAIGIGIFITVLQFLAISGNLYRAEINIFIFAGLALTVAQAMAVWKNRALQKKNAPALPVKNKYLWASWGLIAVALAPTFIAPLSPPREWDELMYHLPHANQWALHGKLTVNEWLRYPWFPYNYNLLYAAALILRGDILTHLLHAFSGWLIALMVYRLGIRYSSRMTATIATLIWLALAKDFFSNAYIELGVALFITTACITCILWLENPAQRGWLVITAFMLGLAAGSKYQALTFLPLFGLAIILRERRPGSIALACIAFLIPCLYWYARNALMTGDPFNPLGGKLFGFHDWSAQDYEWQMLDIKRVANWPKAPLWPLLLVPFLKPWRQGHALRSASYFGLYTLSVWYFTSHYDRYLVPAMPILALLSAWALTESASRLNHLFTRRVSWYTSSRQRQSLTAIGAVAALLILVFSVNSGRKFAAQIASTPEQRIEFLRQNIVAYDLLVQLRMEPGLKIYQWGLEDAIYYAPNPIWGEVFGPWRYADLNGLSVPDLSTYLRKQGFNTLLIRDNALAPLLQQSDFSRYFQPLSSGNGAQAYRLLPPGTQ